jgi:hypothetical protein
MAAIRIDFVIIGLIQDQLRLISLVATGYSKGSLSSLFIKITGDLVVLIIYVVKGWTFNQAAIHTGGAARVKTTTALDLAAQLFLWRQGYVRIPPLGRIRHRDGADELLNIRVLGIFNHTDRVT